VVAQTESNLLLIDPSLLLIERPAALNDVFHVPGRFSRKKFDSQKESFSLMMYSLRSFVRSRCN